MLTKYIIYCKYDNILCSLFIEILCISVSCISGNNNDHSICNTNNNNIHNILLITE